ncbi:MAG: methyl-accepting chemotaxis protein [Methylococcaceae bacterium]|nr:methyl-accepting chemotaxis protein [Methylococcaceae bacterium]MDP3904659.1 methyl-accepting chemotaxis protein [Methylococcaceae bacterium]
MKINMPVTDKEAPMRPGSVLVTRTDLKGNITFANDAFVQISGFTREELIGANHNIVRHPDMPPEAFEDMWATLQKGNPWHGMVKNRAKSGDYYWVNANAMPVFKNAQVHEYLSVRHVPKPKDIEAAERLYRDIKNKKASINPKGLSAVVKNIRQMPFNGKMFLMLAGFLAPIIFLIYQLVLTGQYGLLAGALLSALLASVTLWSFVKTVGVSIEKSIHAMYRLSEGKFGSPLDIKRKDLIGDFFRALYATEVKLGVDIAQTQQSAAEALRIIRGLENVQSSVLLADTNLNIIFINRSAVQLFKNAESDFQSAFPGFNADRLLGANIDLFHKNPGHQRNMLKNLTQKVTSEVEIAGHIMRVIVNPVMNDNGELLGFVAEWMDRTQDVRIEREIEHLVQSVKEGDLSHRISLVGKHGFTQVVSESMNDLTDTIETAFSDINRVMEAMAAGDMTSAITNEYQGVYAECKNNINDTTAKLSEFVQQIRDAAIFIDSSAQEMASGNNNLSHRVEQQAASLEETAASMEELASTVKHNAENTQQANQVVDSARQLAEKGGDVVKSAIAAMQEINESSNRIAEIISVIDEIAFQTNLLALNASVEAARAGEQGRGFSVVATEVRNLAQRSADAAKQSNELIQNSVQKVRAGTSFVNETGAALNEIVESVARVGDLVAHIAGASAEQTAGIDQVNLAVAQMDDITQQNAALAEQAAASAMAMSEQSGNMTKLINFFKVKGQGGSVRAPTRSSAPAPKPAAASKPKVDNSEWEEF